jgi:integrase
LPSGRWELRVSVGRDPLMGKYRYKSKVVDANEKRDARRQAIAWEGELSDGRLSGQGGTFGQLCEEWIKHKTRRWSPATLKEHRRIVDRYLGSLRNVDVARIGTHTLDVLYAELSARGGRCQRRPCAPPPCPKHGPRCERKGCRRRPCEAHEGRCAELTPCESHPCRHGGPLTTSTVHRIHVVVHAALQQAVAWGWIARNPADHADPGEILEEEIEPPEDVDIIRILAEAESLDPRLALYLLVSAETGARRGAMHALRWTYFDLSSGTLRFPRVIVVGPDGLVERPASRSKRSGRKVALSPYCVAALVAHREKRTELTSAAGAPLPVNAFIFSDDPLGLRPWRPDSTDRRFRQLRSKVEMNAIRLHDFRHYMATTLLAAGVDPKTVAQRGGWTKVATMLDRYAHALPASDRAAADAIGGSSRRAAKCEPILGCGMVAPTDETVLIAADLHNGQFGRAHREPRHQAALPGRLTRDSMTCRGTRMRRPSLIAASSPR